MYMAQLKTEASKHQNKNSSSPIPQPSPKGLSYWSLLLSGPLGESAGARVPFDCQLLKLPSLPIGQEASRQRQTPAETVRPHTDTGAAAPHPLPQRKRMVFQFELNR